MDAAIDISFLSSTDSVVKESMSEIAKKIDEIIKLGFAELLKSHGFKKSGRNWNKPVENGWLLVDVQASTSNRGALGRFAINLGVYNSQIAQITSIRELTGSPKCHQSTLSSRLGATNLSSDHWWEISQSSDLDSISQDIVSKFSDEGLAWLTEHNSLRAISEALSASPGREAFAAAFLLGDEEEAIRRIKRAMEDRPKGAASMATWAEKVGLKID